MFAVIGHYTPTDAELAELWPGQGGNLDADVSVALYETREAAEAALPWYPDGFLVVVSSGPLA